uniref:Plastid lipid-associated protein/fibrillin conserved domain-containing protein n=1 Tax=Eucampia antarctica TaxID=49252 RepID=A0A7S2R040_9STRA|mmetsp:Transcript_10806/g.10313  ORF Transcript_10806/g.10313 Transcript_10806/m.10313 type:complete len:206 (+) Transcript_10806:123-740(+)|eukprot:CAMPEP_0197832498 /NCGR_PEP_ID=MMETSP1437-20131217/15065_1 /TAXON_ID=49252 ORGANISM="Eucampia antarctica, Strain CCMP1452" /NCGR_SAMPLE_ID=MMETSP1437 /ASSEMBLY_ACC=CAM_ASM_001096 /LENGTH=205 /DNA_ID=CAMNT_0043435907 /DNA_START=120 /DNA_END=737 /DNA_ORIENTATION=+
MKLNTLSVLIALAFSASTSAFTTGLFSKTSFRRQIGQCMSNDNVNVELDGTFGEPLDRRGALSSLIAGGSAMLLGGQPAFAASAQKTVYLTEPTDEFKESEKQRMEFRQTQFRLKTAMQTLLDRIAKEDDTEAPLVSDLEALQDLIVKIGGMPLGIKRDDLVKQVRSRKAKGPWGTKPEYAYQDVIREISFQQSPNKDKDVANPL